LKKNLLTGFKNNLQEEINRRTATLKKVDESEEKCVSFLLANSETEVAENTDIIEETLKTIVALNSEIEKNSRDIKSIENSIKSLEGIANNSVDDTVFQTLNAKIKEIADKNHTIDVTLSEIKPYIELLLNLEVPCPECGGGGKTSDCKICEGRHIAEIKTIQYYNNPQLFGKTIATPVISARKVQNPTVKNQSESGFATYNIARE